MIIEKYEEKKSEWKALFWCRCFRTKEKRERENKMETLAKTPFPAQAPTHGVKELCDLRIILERVPVSRGQSENGF